MNNVKLAKAISALYLCTGGGDGEWTDTDEAIQQAAFGLLEQADCSAEGMAVMLHYYSPLHDDTIADILDISIERVITAVADDKAAEDARRYAAMVAYDDAARAWEDVEW